MDFKEVGEFVEYKLVVNEEEKSALLKVCNDFHMTVEEFVNAILDYSVNHPDKTAEFIRKNRTDRCGIGTIGHARFKQGDEVGFYLADNQFCKGTVEIVDSYGTSEQSIEPSYDVFVQDFMSSGSPCLCKHIRESDLYTMDQ